MEKGNRLVVADSGWAESIPQWLKDQIAGDRIMNGMLGIAVPKGKTAEIVCDAELVAYLMTASLRGPLSGEDGKIYLYLTAKVMLRANKIEKPEDLPDFMKKGYKAKNVE